MKMGIGNGGGSNGYAGVFPEVQMPAARPPGDFRSVAKYGGIHTYRTVSLQIVYEGNLRSDFFSSRATTVIEHGKNLPIPYSLFPYSLCNSLKFTDHLNFWF